MSVDVEFRDPARGDSSLLPSSPAVDCCDDSRYTTGYAHVQREPRCYDHPANSNVSPILLTGGTFDLGIAELYITFTDGFESGDVTAWSP